MGRLLKLAVALALAVTLLGAAQAHNANHPPGTKATVDYCSGVEFQLDAAAADPEGSDLIIAWQVLQEAGPQWSLEGEDTLSPTFCTLDRGVFILELSVSDGENLATDTVTLVSE